MRPVTSAERTMFTKNSLKILPCFSSAWESVKPASISAESSPTASLRITFLVWRASVFRASLKGIFASKSVANCRVNTTRSTSRTRLKKPNIVSAKRRLSSDSRVRIKS